MMAVHQLADAFLQTAARAAPPESLEPALRALLQAGREAWPDLTLDEREFAAHLARHAPRDEDPLEWLASVRGADLYLACGCALLQPAALSAFDRQLLAKVPGILQRHRTSPEVSEEVRQLLRERLFLPPRGDDRPRIAGYSGRGPLATWVKVAALRVAASVTRRPKQRVPLEEVELSAQVAAHDPELQILKGRHGAELSRALRDAFEALEGRDRALLRMHFLDGLNLDRLGLVFQVSRATAGRMMLAARNRLLEGTLAVMRERLRVGPEELASLLGALRSKLDVSLHALLREPES